MVVIRTSEFGAKAPNGFSLVDLSRHPFGDATAEGVETIELAVLKLFWHHPEVVLHDVLVLF